MTDVKTKTTSKAQWVKAGVHTIRLHSGVYVDIRIPDLPDLIESGEIPNDLLDVAVSVAQGKTLKPSKELISQQKEFTNKLVSLTVVEPKITVEEASGLPVEDKELLVDIATRQRDLDAEGHHIGGLEKSEDFRKFRGLESSDEGLASL